MLTQSTITKEEGKVLQYNYTETGKHKLWKLITRLPGIRVST